MIRPRTLLDRLRGAVPQIELPQIGKEVSLPVYVVHNSTDPEDYFFIFDFEQFVEGTRAGWFVRPKLAVWAGRDDFSRSQFARQYRECFAKEFDIARAQLTEQKKNPPGWFGYLALSYRGLRGASVSELAANVVLLVGLSMGKVVLGQILPKAWLTGKSDEAKLEDGIASTRDKVDAALASIEVRLHPELYAHAYRGELKGKNAALERDAWPLPAYVRAHLEDKESGAWW